MRKSIKSITIKAIMRSNNKSIKIKSKNKKIARREKKKMMMRRRKMIRKNQTDGNLYIYDFNLIN